MASKPTAYDEIKGSYNAPMIRSERSTARIFAIGDSLASPSLDRMPLAMLALDAVDVTAIQLDARGSTSAIANYSNQFSAANRSTLGLDGEYVVPDVTATETMGLPVGFIGGGDGATGDSVGRLLAFSPIIDSNANSWAIGTSHVWQTSGGAADAKLVSWLIYCPESAAGLADIADLRPMDRSTSDWATLPTDITSDYPAKDMTDSIWRGSYSDNETIEASNDVHTGRVNRLYPDSYYDNPGAGGLVCRLQSSNMDSDLPTPISSNRTFLACCPVFAQPTLNGNVATWTSGRYFQNWSDSSWSIWSSTQSQPSAFFAGDGDAQYPTGADPKVGGAPDEWKVCRLSDLRYFIDHTTLDPTQPIHLELWFAPEQNTTKAQYKQAIQVLIDDVKTWPGYGFCSSAKVILYQSPMTALGTANLAACQAANEPMGLAFAELAFDNPQHVASIHMPAIMGNHFFGDTAFTDAGADAWLDANLATVPTSDTRLSIALTKAGADYTDDLLDTSDLHPLDQASAQVFAYAALQEIATGTTVTTGGRRSRSRDRRTR